MRGQKKRRARKVTDDKEGEANLPARKTKEIAASHPRMTERAIYEKKAMKTMGENEDGKELFDFVLNKMASPDNQ